MPSDGNCTGTLGHLDPYIRGETPVCDPTQPSTCQVGDLSGKHGNMTTNPFQSAYLELYTTTTEGPGAFFGNRSVVIHNQNLTRLTCANFTLAYAGYGAENATGTATIGGMPAQFTGGAATRVMSGSAIAAFALGAVAFIL